MNISLSLAGGLLLGTMAVATAPAATWMVLHEYKTKGPTTEHVLSMIGINNLVSIIFFSVVFISCSWLGWLNGSSIDPKGSMTELLFSSVGSIILGMFLGILLKILHSRLPTFRNDFVVYNHGVFLVCG